MKEYLEQRMQSLMAQREQLWADVNATIGAIQECEMLLQKINEDQEEGA